MAKALRDNTDFHLAPLEGSHHVVRKSNYSAGERATEGKREAQAGTAASCSSHPQMRHQTREQSHFGFSRPRGAALAKNT